MVIKLGEPSSSIPGEPSPGVSVLLFQDLAVVPPAGDDPHPGPARGAGQRPAGGGRLGLPQGVVCASVLLAVGKWLLPLLFFEVARARSDELFVLSALLVALLAAFLTQWMGRHGARCLLAGMMLGSPTIVISSKWTSPFRDVLMGLFFITIGMTMDWALVAGARWQVLACVTGLILCKSLLILLAVTVHREDVDNNSSGSG